jgi:protein TonB
MTITAPAGLDQSPGSALPSLRLTRHGPARGGQNPVRQAAGVAIVVALHVGFIYALAAGLGHQAVEIIQAPFQTKIIEEVKPPPPDAPPPPPPKLAQLPPPYIPPPDIQIRQPVAAPTNAITAVVHEKPPEPVPTPVVAPPPPPAPKAEPVRVPAVIDAAHRCQKPEYPAMSQRLGEEGTVVLKFLVGVDGAVVDSRVETSSGHPKLDEAARAALGGCRFKAGTVDGKPEQSWAVLKYNWKIE